MKNIFLVFFLFFAGQWVYSQADFQAQIWITSYKDTLYYRELLPENYNPHKKYPLVLFLHGAGERGSDNKAQLTHGSKMFTNPVHREKYPAIVLFPQCSKNAWWDYEKRSEERDAKLQAVKELLDSYLVKETVDTKRVYIMGLSMGGFGTFDLVCRFPDIFAAAIPICGGILPVERLKATAGKVKFRIYHGDNDDTVPVENSRKAYRALKEYGADVEYFEFAGVNHNSWNPAFNQPDFLKWLFEQKK